MLLELYRKLLTALCNELLWQSSTARTLAPSLSRRAAHSANPLPIAHIRGDLKKDIKNVLVNFLITKTITT